MYAEVKPGFNPITWEIYEDFTEEEFSDAVALTCGPAPEGQLGVSHKSRKLHLPQQLRSRAIDIVRTREHEWTHFRQHISTPLGLFKHTLCATREQALIGFYRECPSALAQARRPFIELIQEETPLPDPARAFLFIWYFADLVDGVLWSKTMALEALIHTWDMLLKGGCWDISGRPPKQQCRLTTRLPMTESAVPDGHIRVQDLVEGFALYRELQELKLHYGEAEALRILRPVMERGDNGIAGRYIYYHLNIPFQHPMSGALQEAAMLCFVNPLLSGEDNELVWEDIHPGLRFESTVMSLRSRSSFPQHPREAYELALAAYGLAGRNWHSGIDRIAGGDDTLLPLDRADRDLTTEWLTLHFTYQSSFFSAGLKLRRDFPDIYYFPQLYFPPPWNRFIETTTPPLLVNPRGMSLPRARNKNGLLAGLTMVQHAFGAAVADDVARFGTLKSARHIREAATATFPGVLAAEKVDHELRALLGSGYNEHLDRID